MDRERFTELLSEYVDGTLGPRERSELEARLRTDADARTALRELQETVRLVGSLPRHAAPRTLAADVMAQLERRELLSEWEQESRNGKRKRRMVLGSSALAAMIALAMFGAWYVGRHGAVERQRERQLAAGDASEESLARSRELQTAPASPMSTRADLPPIREATLGFAEGPAEQEAEQQLLAVAALDQKLQAGYGVDAVVTHPFANESNRITVYVADDEQKQQLQTQIETCLAREDVTALTLPPAPPAVAKTTAAPAGPPAEFYYLGNRGVNFAGSNESQILLRVDPEKVAALVTELGNAVQAPKQVAMQVGPLRYEELNEAQHVAEQLAQNARNLNEGADQNGHLGAMAMSRSVDPLEDVARLFGVDLSPIVEGGPPQPESAADDIAAGAARDAVGTAERQDEADAIRAARGRRAPARSGTEEESAEFSRAKEESLDTTATNESRQSMVERRMAELERHAGEATDLPTPEHREFWEDAFHYTYRGPQHGQRADLVTLVVQLLIAPDKVAAPEVEIAPASTARPPAN